VRHHDEGHLVVVKVLDGVGRVAPHLVEEEVGAVLLIVHAVLVDGKDDEGRLGGRDRDVAHGAVHDAVGAEAVGLLELVAR
jgi:hypothetical protein